MVRSLFLIVPAQRSLKIPNILGTRASGLRLKSQPGGLCSYFLEKNLLFVHY